MYNKVNPKQSFPKLEEEVLEFWNREKIFEESLDRPDAEEFNFYDGPPFATGTPHYGHILAGTIKDVIPRYQTMLGKKVSRRFGWDTHGLPIENIVEKKLGISGKDDIEKIGVHKFNEECRANVFGYVDEWKQTVNRMGRWVDMENDYKTMDTDFMESVWWVFKTIYDKGLVYEGNRIVPYCPRCTTPLSNFEVNQGYKDKQDKTATVKFKVVGNENKYILAWTTTPWTLVANLGLAVGADIDYVELLDKENNETYVLAKDLVKNYYKQPKNGTGTENGKNELQVPVPELETDNYRIIREYKGTCLAGIKYEPLFDDFEVQLNQMGENLGTGIELGENSYCVVIGHHVTTESGTGIVHIAPAYGEDDNLIGKKEKLGFVAHINDSGKTYNLLENNEMEISAFNELILTKLKDSKTAILINTINHSYPHCWRCDTPLIYRAISAWYVAVEKIRDKMVANNQKVNWTPDIIKNGRFGKWVEGARDWNISRNRYWGSAMPVWQSEDKKNIVVIGSIEELYQANKEYGQIEKVKQNYAINICLLPDEKTKDKCIELNKLDKESEYNNNDLRYIPHATIIMKSINKTEIDSIIDEIKKLKFEGIELETDSYYQKQGGGFTWTGINIRDSIVLSKLKKDIFRITEKYTSKHRDKNSYAISKFFEKSEISIIDEKYFKLKEGLHITFGGKEIKEEFESTDFPNKINFSSICVGQMGNYGSVRKDITVENTLSEYKYIYTNTGEEVDLHKHFVDEIFVKNENNFKAKNVLGIHGFTGNIENNDFWKSMQSNLQKEGINIDLPQFPEKRNTYYHEWEKILNKIDFSKYDTIISHSLGTRVISEYLLENNITNIKRLILVGASNSGDRTDGTSRPELVEFYKEFKNNDLSKLNNIIDEICSIHSKDDKSVPFNEGKYISNIIGSTFLEVDGFGHFNEKEYSLLEGLVKFGTPLKRIPEVLDCWFESGSMPYASNHYMGENNSPLQRGDAGRAEGENFNFPADFIAEGLDQTRGWFYTLLILSTALFDSPAIKNTIVNGIVLAEDGKKMSKSLKNFPDPKLVFDKYGADAMRFYLMNSPVVEAQDFRFQESGVEEIVKKVILPLWNTYSFFTTYANIDKFEKDNTIPPSKGGLGGAVNPLDKWIVSETNKLVKEVKEGLDGYKINEATKNIPAFMDNLTNWYIRRSRKRFWKSENDGDKMQAYNTLHEVLVTVSKLIAPFMPFIAENMYQNLTGGKSVHLTNFPEVDESLINEELSASMDKTKKIINLGLAWRVNHKLKVRQPLKSVTIGEELSDYYKNILKEELNVKEVIEVEGTKLAQKICMPNGRAIGPKFGKNVKDIMKEAKSGNFEELDNGTVRITCRDISEKHLDEFILEDGDFELIFQAGDSSYEIEAGFGMVIALDSELNEELKQEGKARDLVRAIQDARKQAEFNVEDRIEINISGNNLEEIITNFGKYIEAETLSKINSNLENSNLEKEIEIGEEKIVIMLKK